MPDDLRHVDYDLEAGDEVPSNTSANPRFTDIAEARLGRRGMLVGGLGAAISGFIGAGRPAAAQGSSQGGAQAASQGPVIGFKPVPISANDTVVVPEGYSVQVMIPQGTPLSGQPAGKTPAEMTAAEQGMAIGAHHDGMHFFPIEGRHPEQGSSTDGLLVLNHEYIEPRTMHARAKGMSIGSGRMPVTDDRREAEEVQKEINAHGVSIVRVARQADGKWAVVADPRSRRITAATPTEIAGPVRGHALVRTKYSPDGTRVRGTLNNCAHGYTPWNTYLTCEENWAGYFRNLDQQDQKPNLPREQARYGVPTGQGRYNWDQAANGADEFIRFNVSSTGADATQDYRNEVNAFGWIVEIDPFNPGAMPAKRTALGRFAHEGIVFAPAREGQPVVAYSGDDSRFEYIYKFVSARPFNRATANGALLDEGTLYAAKFNADGSGEWLPLVHGQGPLTAANGFADQGEVLVNTRLAADAVGATKMDRPEWGAVDPRDGRVYFTLTNNTRRTEAQVDPANPRARNQFGQIIRWREANDDHAATRFAWDLFLIAGPEDSSRIAGNASVNADNMLACPDGLWFDADSRLWIQTDIGESEQLKGDLAPFGNNQMLCANPITGEMRRFLTGPNGQEITGVVTTPDRRTMFVNVQHPGATTSPADWAAGKPNTSFPNGSGVPLSATLVITKNDGGIIGT
ncbi:PhoX family phosphatase [Roseomonas frigidaquae]|uniref:PhoX family phosphatase n=1 Tax=Falsiroseomonas frigidaquae TaxID=487318 RepID=A0ABX1F6H6_9PROT|nr:PhoX family phosphatase [Falsiroseomonas frigidaquae]NKE47964.1 PhoX family phosphatase [Falsiroseomonas frigidaquae]